jgi:general secretion pathway protein K
MEFAMKRQRGMAVVMALLLVALAASAVALVLWQQNLWWHQVEAERRRAQIRLLADAELSWGMSRVKAANVVALSQPWARPLAVTEQGFELRARLIDMQGRFNLNALAKGGGQIDLPRLAQYRSLLAQLRLPATLADALIRWQGLRSGEVRPGSPQPRFLTRWRMLEHIPGYSAEVRARLEPFATVLPPENDAVNVNTASPQLLTALFPQIPEGTLAAVLSQREQNYFRDVADFRARLGGRIETPGLSATSSLFLLEGTVTQGGVRRVTRGLIKVEPGQVKLLWREDGPQRVAEASEF